MTKKQYNKLIADVVTMDIDGNIYDVTKTILGNDPVLIANYNDDGELTEITFTQKELMSGIVSLDGDVYIAEMENGTDCLFWPFTSRNVFTGKP